MPFRPCLPSAIIGLLSAFLPNPCPRCVGLRNRVQPSGRWLDDMPPRRYCLATLRKPPAIRVDHVGSALIARHYAVRGAEFLSEHLLLRALALVRARSLFVDLIDGLTP